MAVEAARAPPNPAGSASDAITISDRYVCRKYPPSGCGSSCRFSIQYFAFWFVNFGSVANKSRKSAFSCQDPLDDVVPRSGLFRGIYAARKLAGLPLRSDLL